MINNVTLVGRLTDEVKLNYTQSGIAVGNFILAVNRPFKSKDGEEQADFIRCVVWRKTAENTANYVGKGDLVGIVGRIETGSYDDQDGKRVYTTDVVVENIQFLQTKGNGTSQRENNTGFASPQFQQQSRQGQPAQRVQQNTPPANFQQQGNPFGSPASPGTVEVKDDDLPF